MDLAKHISDLLFKTDRVVVPGLGVFSTKYIPASIHPAKQTFEPPKKEVLFTSSIKDDNGLLIKHIAEKEGIKDDIAREELEKYVKQYNTNLSEGKKLKFINLGILSLNSDGTYLFKADKAVNYLSDAFGLGEISLPKTIKTEEKKKALPKKNTLKPKKEKKTKKPVWILYIIIPLAAIIVLAIFNFDLIKNKWDDSFSKPETVVESTIQQTEDKKVDEEQNLTDTLKDSDTLTIPEQEIDTVRESTIQQQEQAVPDKIEETKTSKKYYIVAGSFSSEKNALKLVEKLKSKGFNSEIFGATSKGLQMVSYDSYENKKDASDALRKIMREENSGAWMIKY